MVLLTLPKSTRQRSPVCTCELPGILEPRILTISITLGPVEQNRGADVSLCGHSLGFESVPSRVYLSQESGPYECWLGKTTVSNKRNTWKDNSIRHIRCNKVSRSTSVSPSRTHGCVSKLLQSIVAVLKLWVSTPLGVK